SFGGNNLSVAGIYSDTLSINFCDSIITLNLIVTDYLRDTITAFTCVGFPYSFNGNNLTVAGIYSDTLSTSTCDSIITLNLTYTDFIRDTITTTICSGEFFLLGTNQISSNGIFTDTLSTSTCDSIIILNLTVAPFKRDTIVFSICSNDSATIGNNVYKQTGTYTDTLSTNTCDSILTINLTVLPFGFDTIYPTICDYENFNIGNSSFNTNGTYTDTFPTIGCDSIITIFLTVNNSPTVNIIVSDTVVISGDVIKLNTSTYNANYQWNSIADFSSYTIQNPSATITASAWIYLIVENNFGCIAQDSVYITVKELECSERKMYVPNAFSPNGDDKNDTFFPIPQNVEFKEMQIFNRWGQQVYETTDIKKSWDGTFKNQINLGIYVYWIKYFGCKEELLKGTVLLLE
ncbi:MAG: gliding motility-associated C-terminal domain-containing protein, partial [Pseudomonadota bacterium]